MSLAQEATVWGFPLVFFGRYLDAAVENGVVFNRFYMAADIASPQSKAVGPNIDTLNGRAWIDLDTGPQVISVPDTQDRYYTIQLQDMYMNSFAYIGRRTTGTNAGSFVITPPGYSGPVPASMTEIKAATNKVFAFVRTLVRGPADLDNARAINESMTLGSVSDFPDRQVSSPVTSDALDAFQLGSRVKGALPHKAVAMSGAGYFDELDRLTTLFPPLPWDAANLVRFAKLGLGGPRDASIGDTQLAQAVEAGVALAVGSVRSKPENGWLRRENVVGTPKDPLIRAADNVYGPGTQIAEESLFYNLRKGPDGEALSGENTYRLFFPAGQLPPVDAFWSLTLYDGNYFLFDNLLDRYGISDRTDGMHYGEDGSLEILIQPDQPESGCSNWLPAPKGPFQLVFRTYQPCQPVIDGTYRLPPLEKLD